MMRTLKSSRVLVLVLLCVVAAACGKKKPVVAVPMPAPPPSTTAGGTPPPAAPQPVTDVLPVPPEPLAEDAIGGRSLDDLNRESPFKPVFFGLDSSDLDAEGQKIAQENGAVLRKYPTWVVTIEGHADERGTAEYNLALGERRAMSARTYLVALGIAPDRLRVVSYGKEFPFDPAHDESAWAKNRRAHFVIMAK